MLDTAKFWDKHADKYAQTPITDEAAYAATLDRVRTYLSSSHKVLEIGCGTGSTALSLAPHVGQMSATDLSEKMVGHGRRKAQRQGVSNIDFRVADMMAPELTEQTFDVVMAFNLLHLVHDFDGALSRAHAMLKPGGLFISKTICKPVKRAPLKYYVMMTVLPVMQAFGKAPMVRVLPIEEFEGRIINAGFKIIETGNYPDNPPRRFVVARKE